METKLMNKPQIEIDYSRKIIKKIEKNKAFISTNESYKKGMSLPSIQYSKENSSHNHSNKLIKTYNNDFDDNYEKLKDINEKYYFQLCSDYYKDKFAQLSKNYPILQAKKKITTNKLKKQLIKTRNQDLISEQKIENEKMEIEKHKINFSDIFLAVNKGKINNLVTHIMEDTGKIPKKVGIKFNCREYRKKINSIKNRPRSSYRTFYNTCNNIYNNNKHLNDYDLFNHDLIQIRTYNENDPALKVFNFLSRSKNSSINKLSDHSKQKSNRSLISNEDEIYYNLINDQLDQSTSTINVKKNEEYGKNNDNIQYKNKNKLMDINNDYDQIRSIKNNLNNKKGRRIQSAINRKIV